MSKNKKDKYNIIIDDQVEFVLTKKDKKKAVNYKLKRSNGEQWTEPNELISELVDDGQTIIINGEMYNYHEVAELYVLLKTYIKINDDFIGKLKISKS